MKQTAKFSIFLIPIGVAINFVGAQIAMLLKLPIYLDAIGTFVVGALCGGIPGAIVGVISNTINSITYPTYMWYGVISLIYGLIAAFLSQKKIFTSFWKTLFSAFLFAFIGGTLNSIITWILYGFDFAGDVTGVFGLLLYNNLGFPKFLAELVSAIGMDIADKLISILAMFFVLRSMPNRLLTKLQNGEIYLKHVEEEDESEE
jgi:energy-coupling factor transport system substrate-specific component